MTICYHVSAVIYTDAPMPVVPIRDFSPAIICSTVRGSLGFFFLKLFPLTKSKTYHRPKEQIMRKLEKKVGFHLSLQP